MEDEVSELRNQVFRVVPRCEFFSEAILSSLKGAQEIYSVLIGHT